MRLELCIVVVLTAAAYPSPPTAKGDRTGGLISSALNDLQNLTGLVGSAPNVFDNILTDLQLITATAAPITVSAATSRLSNAVLAPPNASNIYVLAANLIAAGLTTNNARDLVGFLRSGLSGANSEVNVNLRNPSPRIYPKASPSDAPYDLTEAKLRGAIHIPSRFRYGKADAPQPIILVPGTGDNGYTNFAGNLIPLLTRSRIADPVWLNIPGLQLNDVQRNAEYVAYAINYIYGICGQRPIALASWSQGGIDIQWATKYWPSTRSKITDVVAFSPDYHGTILANFAVTPDIPLPPSILQQAYTSDFIKVLRSNGGDSAYVPTTTIYSGFLDEIVEPQQGVNASAFLFDARGVGVTNNEVQSICPNAPAGGFYTHEGVLYNPIGFALLVDALSHDGPGQVSRMQDQLDTICGQYLTTGLDLSDFFLTEDSLVVAVLATLLHPDKVEREPPIRVYAL